ncbi:MAG: MFS transporter [Gammaproteobacteria bacterium]
MDRQAQPQDAQEAGAYRWYVLALLALTFSLNSIDRNVLAVVLEPVKREFGASDAAMGFLSGLAYTLTFAMALVPAGWLVDRVDRRRLLAAILAAWSALTALSALARNFGSLLALRMSVGAAEAGAGPCAMSILSDYFGPRERSTAIGIYYTSSAIGVAGSFALGGWVAAEYGWRAAFLVAGLPGLVLALVILATLREPRRGATDGMAGADGHAAGFGATLSFLVANRALVHVVAGMTLAAFVTLAVLAWSASFLVRVHGLGLRDAGLAVAVATGVFQAAGTALVGHLADRFGRDSRARMARVAAVACVATAVSGTAMASATSTAAALAGLFALAFTLASTIPPTFSLLLGSAAPRMRGTLLSLVLVCTNLLGGGLGPWLTGAGSDAIGGPRALAWALGAAVLVDLWAALHFELAARRFNAAPAAATPA